MQRISSGARTRLAAENGQDTVELAGLLVLVAAIVVALISLGLPARVAHVVECAVGQILRIEVCQQGARYPVNISVHSGAEKVDVSIGTAGQSYTEIFTRYSDGTSTLQLAANNQLGVAARWGGHLDLPGLVTLEAEAQVSGGGELQNANQWTFPSWRVGEHYAQAIGHPSGGSMALNSLTLGVFGSHPPSGGSIPKRYRTTSSTGGGGYVGASASGKAGVGPLSANVTADGGASLLVSRVPSGPYKGDWQQTISLDGGLGGVAGESVFGSNAGGTLSGGGDAQVIYGPDGKPAELEITEYRDGVWHVTGAGSPSPADVADQLQQQRSNEDTSGEHGGGREAEPVLQVDSNGGAGAGTLFTGTLELVDNPKAQSDVGAVLGGRLWQFPAVMRDMNTDGTEVVQTEHITRSDSTAGVEFYADPIQGAGLDTSTGSSQAHLAPPEVRSHGGQWHLGATW